MRDQYDTYHGDASALSVIRMHPRLKIAVMQLNALTHLPDPRAQQLADMDRAMFSPGATDGDSQVAFALGFEARQQ